MIATVRDTLIVLALVAGPPIGLLAVAGSPIPDRLPSAAVVAAWVHDPLQPPFAAVMAVTAGWLLWSLYTGAILACLAAQARLPRARLRRMYACLPGPVQGLTATVLGAAAVTTAAAPVTAGPPAATSDTATVDTHHLLAAASPGTPGLSNTPTPARSAYGTAEHHDKALLVGHAQTRQATVTGDAAACVVRRGDTLFDIAARRLGDGNRWPEIYALNRGTHFSRVGGTLSDPDLIYPGWTLKLPHHARVVGDGSASTPSKPRSGAAPVPAPPRPSHESSGQPDNPASPPNPHAPGIAPPSTPSSRPSSAAGNDKPDAESTPAAASSQPPEPGITTAPTAPSPTSSGSMAPRPALTERPASADDAGWIEVTGGFLTAGLAAGLVYAAGLVWRRRRHRYRPTPITSLSLDEPDALPPLAALTRLRHSVRRSAPQLLNPAPEPGPTVHEYLTAPVKPPLPATGPSGAELAGLGTLPATGGVGLDGPAALDAARAVLVAVLTSGGADQPHAQGHAVIPAATLAELLGVSAVDLHPTRRLTVAATIADALTMIEEEIIRRSRIVADQQAADVAALRQQSTFAEPLPQLLLIADTPTEDWHARLATAVRLGAPVDIGAVLIGAWPHGTTLTVAGDGSTQGGDGKRLAVLDTAATADLLAMLGEAHGATTAPAAAAPADSDHVHAAAAGAQQDPRSSSGVPAVAPVELPRAAAGPVPGRVPARVLGRPAILGDDGNPVRGLRAKSLELFVYLVVHRTGANLDDIMEALWPDVTVPRAAERLSTCVANLRHTIRSLARARSGQPDVEIEPVQPDVKIEPVINSGGHYRLDPNLLAVDWWTILDAYTMAATAADDDTRLTHLHTAIAAAHGGGLADGCDYDWIDTDREHARRRLITIHAHAAALLADTDPHTSRTLYDTACALDPLSDDLARSAMRAAARLGDADGVRHRLAELQRHLDDAGIDIDADTEQLATDLLRDLSTR
jgi:two-component SAPR family response regulator